MDEKRYRISQVAKRFDVSRTALIHYDHIGLLTPSYRNEKQYRYYTEGDMKKLELILALKESGLLLNEIKAYVVESNSTTGLQLLIHQQREIDDRINELKKQRRILSKRIENLKKFQQLDMYEGIKMDDQTAISLVTETIGFGPLMSYRSAIKRLKDRLAHRGQLASKFGICYQLSGQTKSGSFVMKYVFDYLNVDDDMEDTLTLPQGTYLRCLHHGDHLTVPQAIQKLIVYGEEKGLKLGPEAHYVPLFDYWESVSDTPIGEVLIPVEAKDGLVQPKRPDFLIIA